MPRTRFFEKIQDHEISLPSLPNISGRVNISSPIAIPSRTLPGYRYPNKLLLGNGIDTFDITVPDGKQYEYAMAVTLPPSTEGTLAVLESQPREGATGTANLKVKYFCPPGGMIRYRLTAYCDSVPRSKPEELYIKDNQSIERLIALMNSRRPIDIYFMGEDASKINSTGIASGITGLEIAVIIAICATALVSIVALTALTIIVTKAIEKNYDIDTDFTGGEFNLVERRFSLPKMTFKLRPK